MAKVVATQRGYYGRILREEGERFDIPEEVMANKKLRPSWVKPIGGAEQAKAETAVQPPADVQPVDLNAMTVKDLRALAKDRGIGLGADVTTKAEIIAAIEAGPADQAQTAEPFADAPAPVRVSNEINDATGATQPDWVAGGQADI